MIFNQTPEGGEDMKKGTKKGGKKAGSKKGC